MFFMGLWEKKRSGWEMYNMNLLLVPGKHAVKHHKKDKPQFKPKMNLVGIFKV